MTISDDDQLKKSFNAIGVVIIGRNEGERLTRCLQSIPSGLPVVYVDSGSTDSSVETARTLGAHVELLDTTIPFTAARARNLGWQTLSSLHSNVEFIQFIDGDCYFHDGWFVAAEHFLVNNPAYAICCGQRQETHPQASLYNALCDIEWNTPCGDAASCGGDALIRLAALNAVNGYRDNLIAGEEPEMCLRLRRQGHKIRRIDCPMTYHDAAIHHFSQWWRRSVRCGYAYANGAALHGQSPDKHWLKETFRALCWGLFVPLIILVVSLFYSPGIVLLLVYPLLFFKIYKSADFLDKYRGAWSFFMVVSKFSECVGVVKFLLTKILKRDAKIIEYK